MRAQLFNQVTFTGDNGEPIAVPPRKFISLLAYLIVSEGVWLDRSRVALDVWPMAGTKQARDSLRNALSALRRFLPPNSILSTPDAVLLTQGVITSEGSNQDVSECPGPFMPGFEDPWIVEFREAHRSRLIAEGMDAAQALWEQGSQRAALAKLEACCRLDPLHYGAAARRVAFLKEIGHAAESARAARDFSQRAIRDLGIVSNLRGSREPAPNPLIETEAFLYERDAKAAAEFLVATSEQWEFIEAGKALQVHERTLAALEVDSAVRRRLEAKTMYFLWVNGGLGPHMQRAEDALAKALESGEEASAIAVRTALAYGYLSRGEFSRSVRLAREELALSQSAGDPLRQAKACIHLAIIRRHSGHESPYSGLIRQAASLLAEHGSAHDNAAISLSLGSVAVIAGRFEEAADRFAAARSYFEASGYMRSALWARMGEAELLIAFDDFARARDALLAIRAYGVEAAGHSLMGCADDMLAQVGCRLGAYDEGTLAYARAAALRTKLGTVPSVYEMRASRPTRAALRARMSRREIALAYERARAELDAAS